MGEVKQLTERRRLTDLYVRGVELKVDDGSEGEDPITVWVSKISPLEQKDAADRAAGARATVLVVKHFEDDHEDKIPYLDQLAQVGDDRDTLTEFLIAPKLQEKMMSHESELATEDKWSKDNYFESLRESWFSGLGDTYNENPKDPAAKKVHAELQKFADEVERRVEADKSDMIASYDIKSDNELRKEVLDRLIETDGDFAWLAEFRKWQLYYAVREPEDHKRRYFIDKSEVDALDPRVLRQLVDTFLELSVDAIEGKG